jgi:type II secretory pathway pseudopilin PulG
MESGVVILLVCFGISLATALQAWSKMIDKNANKQ